MVARIHNGPSPEQQRRNVTRNVLQDPLYLMLSQAVGPLTRHEQRMFEANLLMTPEDLLFEWRERPPRPPPPPPMPRRRA